jgi:uncharacterized membrane protein
VGTGRIEAFSDGVIAVIITIMVLDLKVPADPSWSTLLQSGPGLAIYLLSFVVVGIFWLNHHHALHAARAAEPRLMWCNLAVLFVLSLIPFVTAYVASAHGSALPVACYAVTLALASCTFTLLNWAIAMQYPADDAVRVRFRKFIWKGAVVVAFYLLAVPLAFANVAIAYGIFVLIPILYVLPDGAEPDASAFTR